MALLAWRVGAGVGQGVRLSTAVIIMAKAPVAGWAKTRLAPALGAEGAAQLAQRLLLHTVHQVAALADVSNVSAELCVTPHAAHPAFETALAAMPGRLALTWQGDGDLGVRMHRALARALQTHTQAVLVGTDAPALTTAVLREAIAALAQHDAVWVPSHDGGYALVGLRQAHPTLFEHMVWSTPQVMQHTRERAQAAGLKWAELAAVTDIDEPSDLAAVPADWLPLGRAMK